MNLKVIKSASSSMSSKDTPNIVLAPSFEDKNKRISLRVLPDLIAQYDKDNFRAKLGEFAGLVHGNIEDGTFGLLEAKALFKGIKRPCIHTNHDADVYVYVTNPSFTYTYLGIPRYGKKPPKKIQAPNDSVFVTYVTLNKETDEFGAIGRILDWEWVFRDKDDLEYPFEYRVRYDKQVW